MDERDYMVAQAQANIIRKSIEALTDLNDFSQKHTDFEMLNIIKKHLAAMQRDVQNLLKDRRK